jgi:ferredoxin-thioredoxin reductase catalytic chain
MDERVKNRLEKLKTDAGSAGYLLNQDENFVADLVEGLITNNDRYGIESCPCRLFTGTQSDNMDIVCPCVYRDDDLAEYGACFCALYVVKGAPTTQVPERRPSLEERQKTQSKATPTIGTLPYPVYRCSVCGYLCANTHPPNVCPICKAKKDRFERFL